MARDLLAPQFGGKVCHVRRNARSRPAICVLMLTFIGCDRHDPTPSGPPGASQPLPSSSSVKTDARQPVHRPIVGELVDIPGGAFQAGSEPAEPGRLPELEPRLYEVELGPFRIDRLPHPNDPDKPPVTGVSRDAALRLCAARGARLCTELEWERACKGPESDRFGSGPIWHERCAEAPSACASGFDVLGMGTTLREWVSSDVIPHDAKPRRAVVRGASATAPPHAHGCARRLGIDKDATAADLGFRCCQGAPNAAVVSEPKLAVTFEKTKILAKRLEQLLAQHEKTKNLAKNVVFFREPDAANTVIARGPGDTKGFSFTVSPLIYRPQAGTEYLVVSARSGETTSFIVVYYVMREDTYKLASSFIMLDEPGPVAFAYDNYIRPRFHFSSCWGCPEASGTSSQTGKILFREPDEVVILQP